MATLFRMFRHCFGIKREVAAAPFSHSSSPGVHISSARWHFSHFPKIEFRWPDAVGSLVIPRGDLMASKSLTVFDKKNLNWGGLKSGKKLSSVICSFTQQGHFVMSSCPQMKPENVISSPPRVEKRVFQLLRFWNLNFPPKFSTFKPPQFGNVSDIIEYLWPGST